MCFCLDYYSQTPYNIQSINLSAGKRTSSLMECIELHSREDVKEHYILNKLGVIIDFMFILLINKINKTVSTARKKTSFEFLNKKFFMKNVL